MPVVHPVLIGGTPQPGRREVLVPASLAARLQLTGGEIHLGAGPLREPARAVIAQDRPGQQTPQVLMDPELLGRLHVPPGARLHMRWDPEKRLLILGPFVGILALRVRGGGLYGEHDPFFRALTRWGERMAVGAYMFGPRDVNWERRCIHGYTYAGVWPLGRWRRGVFPFPDVVYDRLQTRRAEWSAPYVRFRERLARHVPVWFNAMGFFDKWRMHQELSKSPVLARLLPHTERYSGPAQLERFLRTSRSVFLKPIGGSLGLGIICVRRTGSGYAVAYQLKDRAVVYPVGNLARVGRLVARAVGHRPYIIQEGLPLATWRGRPIDVRILVQRTAGGQWTLTKMYVRIAAPGSFTANLSRGGQGARPGPVLRRVFGARHAALLRQLHATGLQCAREMENLLQGTVGELGIDLGIDRRGRLWLIEVNSKPFLQMTREAGSPRTLALSVQRPLRFARYMAGFEEAEPAPRPVPAETGAGA
ncbi:MAG: YheC/YheD family protein [Limnochordales bacterium]|nr:YheC/YheD family protein [Limnochordales bacterium]